MHLVVELLFDAAAEEAVREIWRELGAAGVWLGFPAELARPHISAAVYREPDLPRLTDAVGAFAGATGAEEVSLASWGVFPGSEAVVFLAPAPTRGLLDLHRRLHAELAPFGRQPAYYRPGSWVPHATLARGVPPGTLGAAAEVCQRSVRPVGGWLERVALAEYVPDAAEPRQEHASFALGG